MNRKTLTSVVTFLLAAFYIGIILFALLAVRRIDQTQNFAAAILFQFFGFVGLIGSLCAVLFARGYKLPFLVAVITSAVIYNVILALINFALVEALGSVWFFLVHFILFFLFLLVSLPILLMGRNK